MNQIIAGRTLIFAHRGANKEAAENTRSAFDKALHYPIDGIETDVQLSRDEVPLLWHDRFMDKMGYPGKRIDDFDFTQLQQMNFAGFFSKGQEPEGALSLTEFVDTYRGRCHLQIEIKNRNWEQPIRHRIKMRKCLEIIGPVVDHEIFISSFNLESLIYTDEYCRNLPLYYALREHHDLADVEFFLNEHPFLAGLCMPIEILNDAMIQMLHQHQKGIVTYTCNSDVQIRKALDMKVDVLISDYPQKALLMRG